MLVTRLCLLILLMAAVIPTQSQNQIILELKRPITVGSSIPIKFKRYKRGKLKRVREKSLTVKISPGRYEDKRLVLPYNVDNLQNHQVKVVYSWSGKPNVWYDTLLNVGYSGNVVADFSGQAGKDGEKGGGRLGLFVIGRDGYDGRDGESGQSGKNGEDIEATLDAYYDSLLHTTLLKAIVKSKNSIGKKTYLINTESGKLFIRSFGGDGGCGGRGGSGGDGKNAKPKTEKKRSKAPGCGGDGGNGGYGGNGGNGGMITIFVRPAAKEYMHLVSAINDGGMFGESGSCGQGGNGGAGGYGYANQKSGKSGNNGGRGRSGQGNTAPIIVFLE